MRLNRVFRVAHVGRADCWSYPPEAVRSHPGRLLAPIVNTTEPRDKMIAVAVFPSASVEYFSYRGISGCGFLSVTLHGEGEDCADLCSRMARIAEFDDSADMNRDITSHMRKWLRALNAVSYYMAASFDHPADKNVLTFWQRAFHAARSASSAEPMAMPRCLAALLR